MAFLDTKIGQIRDRAKGYPQLSYYIPKIGMKAMGEYLKAHELLIRVLPRDRITGRELRDKVVLFASLDTEGRQALLKNLIATPFGSSGGVSVQELLDTWLERKLAEGVSDKRKEALLFFQRIIGQFFTENSIKHTSDLNDDTAHDYLKWRRNKNLHVHKTNQISASVLKHELQVLIQLAKLAAKKKWIGNGDLWDDVKIRSTPGVDKKVVLSMSIAEQKELLRRLKDDPSHHDMALLLLVTGMRIGEIETLTPDSIKNNVLSLHGEGIGSSKPVMGKTASAVRTLPVCPTIKEIFSRGFIFQKSIDSFKSKLKRPAYSDLQVHAHRLRYTFAVNKLHAKTDLKTVSYQMGHADITLTSNQYGVFVSERFKMGFEEVEKEAKEWLYNIENNYFL